MYGTIAKFRVKAGKEQELRKLTESDVEQIPGIVFENVYRMDDDPQNLYIVVGFESKEAYRKNAESPDQHQRYLKYRELLEEDPEWHDGEIIHSRTLTPATR